MIKLYILYKIKKLNNRNIKYLYPFQDKTDMR